MQTLTTGDIAKYCGVNFRTVIRWIDKGHLKAFKLPGRGNNRVEAHDFLDFLEQYKIPVPEELRHLTRRVLVVDDDPITAETIQRTLQKGGFEAKTVNDGFQAGAALMSYLPAVMTLDLQMPGLDGFDVLEFVRKEKKLARIKVLVVSASEKSVLQRALDAGADDVLEKPFDLDELNSKVNRLLAQPQ